MVRVLRKSAWAIFIWLAVLGLWLWASYAYPHTIYELRETGDYIDMYDQRVTRPGVEAVPIYEFNNPWYVDFLTSGWIRVFIFLAWPVILLYLWGYRYREAEGSVP